MQNPSIFEAIDCEHPAAEELFCGALRERGFAVLTNHGLGGHDLPSIYEEWGRWFGSEAKYSELDGPSAPLHDRIEDQPQREYFHVTQDNRGPGDLSDAMAHYFDDMNAFAHRLLGWLGTEDVSFSEMLAGASRTRLRIQYYHTVPEGMGDDALRAIPHVDHNLLSLLPAATSPGLELALESGIWAQPPLRQDAMCVMAGSMLEFASAGRYRSCLHRVTVPDGTAHEPRLALIMLMQPGDTAALRRDNFTAGEFIETYGKRCTGFDDHRIF